MQALNENIVPYQERLSMPSVSWKITLTKSSTEYDVSERFKGGNPGIIDSADYRANMSYVNEIVLNLRNDDGYFKNESGTGLLDVADGTLIEVKVYGYFNMPGGSSYPLIKFGGWVDLKKVKPNSKGFCSITAMSYLGRGDYISAANITTQYIDSIGLILWNVGLWLTDAAVTSYILLNGIHTIQTQIDGSQKQAKLDDGDWVNIADNPSAEYTLSNYGDTERVKIYYNSALGLFREGTTYVVVKDEGEQYCETFYYYPNINTILKKAFTELGISSTSLERYDIETYDSRKVPSLLKPVISSLTNTGVSIVSDGAYRIFISVVSDDSSPTPLNQIWYYNYSTDTLTKIYETTLNTYTKHRLVINTTANVLLAWYDNQEEDEERGLIQKIDLTNYSYQTILIDELLENADAYIRFHWLAADQKILLVQADGIYSIDMNGSKTKVINETGIETYGFSCMWEKPGGDYYFYFTKNVGGTIQIWRAQWNGSWQAAEYVKDFHNQSYYNGYHTFPLYAEDKIITLYTKTNLRYFKVTDKSEGAITNSGGYEITTMLEYSSKLYFFAQLTDLTDKRLGYVSNDTMTLESANLSTNRFIDVSVLWSVATQVQKLCIFKNINDEYDLAFICNRPAFVIRFSKYITPYIYGEYNYQDKTIRELLQTIANNFLGYVKITAGKVGYFVSRASYVSSDSIEIKKDYIKGRTTERQYNEVYDAVVVNTGDLEAYRGNRAVDAKILSVSLDLIAEEIIYDMAQYFLDYYSVKRMLITINYPPTFYNYDSLDGADLTELGLPSTGRIHKLAPKKESLELQALYEEET